MGAAWTRAGRLPGTALAALAACAVIFDTAAAQESWRFDDVERIVAVGDVHGAYEAFEDILQRAGVVDDGLAWSGGRTHLVIVGDVVDRGPESRRALDLIRRLEPEALAAGGRVHLVLGNHEIMNMTGDLRYVSAAEYAAFADEEPAGVRSAELERFTRESAEDPADARATFDVTYPPGFFAHRAAFSSTGEYGAWLLEKPVLLVVNDLAFVHGGLAEATIGLGSGINERIREELGLYLEAHAKLVAAGLLSRTVEVYDLPSVVSRLLAESGAGESSLPADVEDAARRLVDLDAMTFLAADGPVWYRGNVGCNRLSEQDRLTETVEQLGARHLVVGHTPTQGGFVQSRMNDLLLRVDTGMLREYYGGRAAALIVEGDGLSVLYGDESGSSQPLPQPRRVGTRPAGLSEEALEAALAVAEVGAVERFAGSASLVTLEAGDVELHGLFTPAAGARLNPAVAAYRLDRLLGLDMVPVTVPREIDGVHGALQFWPSSSIDESRRSAERLGNDAWCPLGDQLEDMYLFDSLIFNLARTTDRIRYSTENFGLLLVGNDRTFSTDRGRPAHLADIPVELTPAWRSALAALDETSLTMALGDVLDRRRIRALLERRDHLIDIAQ